MNTWENNIKIDIKETGTKDVNCICVVQFRDKWWLLQSNEPSCLDWLRSWSLSGRTQFQTAVGHMYNKQRHAHWIDSLSYCSIYTAATRFNAKASSSGSCYFVPAKLHKPVHAVLVVFFLKKKLSHSLF
jgi:hypothetical protein